MSSFLNLLLLLLLVPAGDVSSLATGISYLEVPSALEAEWKRTGVQIPSIAYITKPPFVSLKEPRRDSPNDKARQLYNNAVEKGLGVEGFVAALGVDSFLSAGWNNLGSLLQREGDDHASVALHCAERAIAVYENEANGGRVSSIPPYLLVNLANIYVMYARFHNDMSYLPKATHLYASLTTNTAYNTKEKQEALQNALRIASATNDVDTATQIWRDYQSAVPWGEANLRVLDEMRVSYKKKNSKKSEKRKMNSASSSSSNIDATPTKQSKTNPKPAKDKRSHPSKQHSESDSPLQEKSDAQSLSARASKSYSEHKFEAAIRDAEASLRLDPNNPHMVYLIASSHSVSGRLLKAISLYREMSRACEDATIGALSTVELSNLEQRLCLWHAETHNFLLLRNLLHFELSSKMRPSQSPFSLLLYPFNYSEVNAAAFAVQKHVTARSGRIDHGISKKNVVVGLVTADVGDTNVGRILLGWLRGVEGGGGEVEIVLFCLRESDASVWAEETYESAVKVRILAGLTPHEAGKRIAAESVHILINLNGYTKYHNHELFHTHPAPISAGYLGCPSTFGDPKTIPYLFGDRHVVPPSLSFQYPEKMVMLPSYFVSGSYPLIWPKVTSVKRFLFEDTDFVFCNFNHLNKVGSRLATIWANIYHRLRARHTSPKLWILELPKEAGAFFVKEMVARGVPADSIVVTPLFPLESHLDVKTQCDVFLDSDRYNAHSTATDVLWAGIPLITLEGSLYQSRVAGSHLRTLQHNDLIVKTYRQYEDLAVHLATHPAQLSKVRQSLAKEKLKAKGLFDSTAWVANFKRAVLSMWRVHLACEVPHHIVVPPEVEKGETREKEKEKKTAEASSFDADIGYAAFLHRFSEQL